MTSAENDAAARGASSELPEPLARQEFNEYFRRSRTAMMLADDDRRYLAINHAACLLIGVEPSEIVGCRIDDLTPQEDEAQLPALWRRFLSEGMLEGTYELVRPGDGRRLRLNFSATANLETGMHLWLLASAGTPERKQPPSAADDPGAPISPRELEVLRLVALGLANVEIGNQLDISSETVRNHVRNAREKLGARTKAHAVALAFQRSLF